MLMTDFANLKLPGSSLLEAALARLSARIAPLVRAELGEVLVAELDHHFKEQLLPELRDRVKAIVVEHLPEQVEALVGRLLPEQVEAVLDRLIITKQSQVYSPNKIVAGTSTGQYMTASNALARDFLHPEYQEFCRIYNEPLHLHRKWWEWAFIYDRLSKAGVLRPEMRGLGFGAGTEKLPSFLAHLGASITATDGPSGMNWANSNDASEYKNWLFKSDIINRAFFDDRVSFEFCNMNNIPGHLTDYDFCWSSCSFEHLGSLQHGIDFVINSVERSLKVGGVACHTTELNLSSDDETIETGVTVIYRKRDLERLCYMLEERGHWVEPLRIEPGTLPPDYFVDVPPYRSSPHLKLLYGSYITTSVGILARRGR
jgi:hypothetical protein